MNNMKKIAFVGATVLGMGALTACQSSHPLKDNEHARMMHDHHQPEHKMTPEQREQFHQARMEHKQFFKQMQKACDGKTVGQATQVNVKDKTIDGTCVMRFKPDQKPHWKMRDHQYSMNDEHRPMRGDMDGAMKRHEPLTDAKRAELTQKFDQRLAEHQAKQHAMQQACQGQAQGKAIQLKVGAQTINGQCKVQFQPQAPMGVPPAPMK